MESPVSVYEAHGLPTPSDVQNILRSLVNDTFAVAFKSPSSLLSEKEFSLTQVISVVAESVVVSNIGSERMRSILAEFANIECCLSDGGMESLAVGAIGAFHIDVETH